MLLLLVAYVTLLFTTRFSFASSYYAARLAFFGSCRYTPGYILMHSFIDRGSGLKYISPGLIGSVGARPVDLG